MIVDLFRIALALAAFAALVQVGMLLWLDRAQRDRTYAQAAIATSLLLIVGDSVVRLQHDDPFTVHLYVARALTVGCALAYAVRRLTALPAEGGPRGR